jgi:hypothetical protein
MAASFEKFAGRGRVLNGNAFVADLRYEVRVYPRFIDGTIPGLPRLECRLSGLPNTVPSQHQLTLVMNDGRKLAFYTLLGSSGRVQPTGGIHT